jgi:hypothetical protein
VTTIDSLSWQKKVLHMINCKPIFHPYFHFISNCLDSIFKKMIQYHPIILILSIQKNFEKCSMLMSCGFSFWSFTFVFSISFIVFIFRNRVWNLDIGGLCIHHDHHFC